MGSGDFPFLNSHFSFAIAEPQALITQLNALGSLKWQMRNVK
jgi:hypothetical protein